LGDVYTDGKKILKEISRETEHESVNWI